MIHGRTPVAALVAWLVVPAMFAAGCSSTSGPEAPVYEIVYVAYVPNGSGGEVHAIRPDGTSDRALGLLPGEAWGISVASDGTIAASATTGSFTANLFLLPPAGGTPEPVLTDSGSDARDPSWSPDGSKLVFSMPVGGPYQIQMVDRDGSNLHLVTDGSDGGHYEGPAWSPNGDWIACERYVLTQQGLALMRTDGSDRRILTSGRDRTPDWSPDGSRIAFARFSDSGGQDIYTVATADSADLQQLTTGYTTDTSPAWSPDGSRIAFQSNRDGQFHIYVMNADGSGVTQVTYQVGAQYFPKWRIAP